MGFRDVLRNGAKASMQYGGYGGGYGSGYGDFWGSSGDQWLKRTELDYRREAGLPWENSVFWIALRWIANQYQDADPAVLRYVKGQGEPEMVLDHSYVSFMNEPNGDYDGGTLAWAIVTSLLCAGRCFLIMPTTRLGMPQAMYWVPWWQIVPRWPTDGSKFIGWYDYMVNGHKYALPPENVIHLNLGMNPMNYRVGLSGTEAVLPQLCTINEGARFMAAVTKNPAVFSQLFSPKDNIVLTEQQHDYLKTQLQKQGAGDDKAGILVPNVPLEATKLAWSPEELALDTVLKMPESHICASMGISSMVVNLVAGERRDTYANRDRVERASYETGVMPLQKLVARQFRRQVPVLFAENETASWSYKRVQCLQEQSADRAKRLTLACGGAYMSVNEARKQDNLPPTNNPEDDEVRSAMGQSNDDEEEPGSGSGGSDDNED